MSDGQDATIFTPLTVDHELVSIAVRSLRSRLVLPIGQSFAKNVSDVAAILELPLFLMSLQSLEKHVLLSIMQARLTRSQSDSAPRLPTLDELRHDVRRLHQSEFDKFKHQPQTQQAYNHEARRQLTQLLSKHEAFYPQIRALYSTAISSAWTAFECVAGDTWAVAINGQATKFAQAGFDTAILLDMLTRYSSVAGLEGIANAYALFENSMELTVTLANQDLHELHATRNLLVHYNGVVNRRFKDKVQLPVAVGELVPLDSPTVARLVNAAIMAGCALLQFVDDWLVRHTSI